MSDACGCGCGHGPTTVTLGGPGARAPRYRPEQTVAEVSARPGALEALKRLGINHCCGAHLTLAQAAATAGVPLETVLAELERTGAPA